MSDRAEDSIFRAVADLPTATRASAKDALEFLLPSSDLTQDRQIAIPLAIRSHFRSREADIRREMKLTIRAGLRELQLTAAIAIPSFIGIAYTSRFPHDLLVVIIQNILIVFSWVVIWQPFQTLVFDRWEKATKGDVYRKIAGMEIRGNSH